MAVEVVSVSTGLGSELGSGGLVEGEGIGVWEGGGGVIFVLSLVLALLETSREEEFDPFVVSPCKNLKRSTI